MCVCVLVYSPISSDFKLYFIKINDYEFVLETTQLLGISSPFKCNLGRLFEASGEIE